MPDALQAEIRRLVADEGLGPIKAWEAVQQTEAWLEARRLGLPHGKTTVTNYAKAVRPKAAHLTEDSLDLLEDLASGGSSSLGRIGELLRMTMDGLTELGIEIGRNEHRWERVAELVETLRGATRPIQ